MRPARLRLDWTLENFGPAPIVYAYAHTVGKSWLCHNIRINLPAGGLHFGQSARFSNDEMGGPECLVYKIDISLTDPSGKDTTSPYIERKQAPNISAQQQATLSKANADLAAAQAALPAASSAADQAEYNYQMRRISQLDWIKATLALQQIKKTIDDNESTIWTLQDAIRAAGTSEISLPPVWVPYWDNGYSSGEVSGTFVVGRYRPGPTLASRYPGWKPGVCPTGIVPCPAQQQTTGICYKNTVQDWFRKNALPALENAVSNFAISQVNG